LEASSSTHRWTDRDVQIQNTKYKIQNTKYKQSSNYATVPIFFFWGLKYYLHQVYEETFDSLRRDGEEEEEEEENIWET